MVNNSLGFRLNKNGEPDSSYILDPEKRFTLKSQLDERRRASMNNLDKCNLLLENTENIIQLINKELNN